MRIYVSIGRVWHGEEFSILYAGTDEQAARDAISQDTYGDEYTLQQWENGQLMSQIYSKGGILNG